MTPFVFEKVSELLVRPSTAENDCIVLTSPQTRTKIVCYVSKIDVKNNLLEICDTKYSLRCKFDSEKAVETLKNFVKLQPDDINILGLLGKELHLQEALLAYSVKNCKNAGVSTTATPV